MSRTVHVHTPQMFTHDGWDDFCYAPSREQPDRLTRAQMNKLSTKDRADYDRRRLIWHSNTPPLVTPWMTEFAEYSDDALDIALVSDQRGSTSIPTLDGYPTIGKSTVLEWWALNHQLKVKPDRDPVDWHPVVRVNTLTKPDPKAPYYAILRFLGHPLQYKTLRQEELHDATMNVLREFGVQVIQFDDIQEFWPVSRAGRRSTGVIKAIHAEFEGLIQMAGTGLAQRGVIDDDSAASIAGRVKVINYSPIPRHPKPNLDMWRSFVAGFEAHLVLADHDEHLTTDTMLDYLYQRTHGKPGAVTDLIRIAAHRAIKRTRSNPRTPERITLDLLRSIPSDAHSLALTARHDNLNTNLATVVPHTADEGVLDGSDLVSEAS